MGSHEEGEKEKQGCCIMTRVNPNASNKDCSLELLEGERRRPEAYEALQIAEPTEDLPKSELKEARFPAEIKEASG